MAAPGAAAAQATPAPQPQQPGRPVTDQQVTAGDVAATPITDLNLKHTDIPPLLIQAEQHPYDLVGMSSCAHLAAAVGELDAVLGDDIDVPQAAKSKLSAGRVAQEAVANFIPFRGVIRELSGANAHDRALQVAVYAGTARRSFLKGVGLQKGCHYPARPATAAVIAERTPQQPVKAARQKPAGPRTTRYVSRPVVQGGR
ncbi:MAG: hypothetical protein JF593_11905 [Novosphingobium sp.]|nr:hypothetical protein [Novosphingobium sp.]